MYFTAERLTRGLRYFALAIAASAATGTLTLIGGTWLSSAVGTWDVEDDSYRPGEYITP